MTTDDYRSAGGSAFPTGPKHSSDGISKRDYFAAHIAAASAQDTETSPMQIASRAYAIADAMLSVRE